jgi:aspartyl-tRNA(Asn)/glutamyl-tRNA(Gln) amidotransferase subunit B
MEIVSEPDLRTPEEAGAYMKKIRTLLRFLGVCDGDLEKGNLRCDANVSVRKPGEAYRTRCEIKNLNSIRHIQNAILHEAERHVEVYENGGVIAQETRLWDPTLMETRPLRSKEDAHDYRYFPDPDLLPLRLTEERVAAVAATMPRLPDAYTADYVGVLGLSPYDAGVLTSDKGYVDFYEALLARAPDGKPIRDPKVAANWLTVELFAVLNKQGLELEDSPVDAVHLGGLLDLMASGEISGKLAKQVFAIMLESGKPAAQIVKEHGFVQISDEGALKDVCAKALAANPDAVAKYKAGNDRVFGSFVGFVMKETKGQANPEMVNKLLLELLG